MRFIIALVILLLALLISCRREKLSSKYEYLYGKWNWIYTYKNPLQLGAAEFNPTTDGVNYSVEISKKSVVLYKNNEEILNRKYREISVNPSDSVIYFWFVLKKQEELAITYFLYDSRITITNFPYRYALTGKIENPNGDGQTYDNYFQKE